MVSPTLINFLISALLFRLCCFLLQTIVIFLFVFLSFWFFSGIIFFSVCLSVCLYNCLSSFVHLVLSFVKVLHFRVCFNVCFLWFIRLCLSVHLSIYLPVYLFVCLSVCLLVYLFICLSFYHIALKYVCWFQLLWLYFFLYMNVTYFHILWHSFISIFNFDLSFRSRFIMWPQICFVILKVRNRYRWSFHLKRHAFNIFQNNYFFIHFKLIIYFEVANANIVFFKLFINLKSLKWLNLEYMKVLLNKPDSETKVYKLKHDNS